MNKRLKGFLLILIVVVLGMPTKSASASQATSYTYTFDEKGYYTRTQDAYLPDRTITDLGLVTPDDLFVDDNNILFVADSGNRRIVKYDIDNAKVIGILENESLQNPKGVFVTKAGDIYVADPTAKSVFRFNKEFKLIERFDKPDAPSFSETKYEPIRVAVDNIGNMYIVGEGVYNGVIQLAHTGEFLGYFTVNKTKLTLIQAVQNFILSKAQLSKLVDRVPTTFSNVFISREGVVYTTTMGTNIDGIKKHNTSGANMFKEIVPSWDSLTDVYVDEQGIIYTSVANGYIGIYSSDGELIFEFGSYVTDLDVAGLYSSLPSVAVDKNRYIWTVDGDKGYLQSFKPTDYALMVYSSMGLYEQGLYEESLTKWTEVLRLNQMSVLAHNGVGKAYLRAEKYEEAMTHFKVAGNRTYYSEAFWEVRNNWIQNYLSYFFIGFLVLIAAISIAKVIDKKKRIKYFKNKCKDVCMQVPILKDVLYAVKVPKQPMDLYYYIRKGRRGSVLGASIIYILFFVVYMLYQTSKGFIYQFEAIEDMDMKAIIIGFFAILLLFIICNYLVTSINDGDGSFKQVYMIPAYGSIPAMTMLLTITIISHSMTYNESFLLTILKVIGITWTLITIFLGLMTVHDYTFKETVVSLILTVLFMIIAAIMLLVIIIMWEKLWQFLLTIGKELVNHVLY